MIERIAKLDAAERQLTAAIRLFFQEGSAGAHGPLHQDPQRSGKLLEAR
jgi:hypothetical protein